MRTYVGVDLGGTQLRAALVADGDYSGHYEGYHTTQSAIRTSTESGDRTKVLAHIEAAVAACVEAAHRRKDDIAGIGIAVPDPVSPEGSLVSPTLFRGWDGYPITQELQHLLQRRFGRSVVVHVGNDANLAALAEYKYRTRARGERSTNFVYLTVSTGIGAGLILREQLYEGTNGYAGEYGHIIIEASSATICPGCHQHGCFEVLASGSAIAREGAQVVDTGSATLKALALGHSQVRAASELTLSDFVSPGGITVTALDVVTAAQQGDEVSRSILDRAAHYLAVGISLILHSVNPDHIIVGGGVAQEDEFIWAPAMSELQGTALSATLGVCKIERPLLKGQIGVLGAAYSAMTVV